MSRKNVIKESLLSRLISESIKKILKEEEEDKAQRVDRYGNPIKKGGQGWGIEPSFRNRQGYEKDGRPGPWFSRSVAVATAVLINDKGEWYVLGNERGPGTPDYQGYWNLPCGYLDYNETTEEAAKREVYEETGITCQNIKNIGHSSSPNENRQNVCFFFVSFLPGSIDDYKFSKENMEEGEVGGIKWIPLKDADDVKWAFDHDVLIQKIISKFGGRLYGDNTKYSNVGQMIDKAISLVQNGADDEYIVSFLNKIKNSYNKASLNEAQEIDNQKLLDLASVYIHEFHNFRKEIEKLAETNDNKNYVASMIDKVYQMRWTERNYKRGIMEFKIYFKRYDSSFFNRDFGRFIRSIGGDLYWHMEFFYGYQGDDPRILTIQLDPNDVAFHKLYR